MNHQFIFHLKFWNQYCFDPKIFHPFFFIAPHLWFLCYNLHLPPLYQNPFVEVHFHSTPNILTFVVIVLNIKFHVFVWLELIHTDQHKISLKPFNYHQ